MAYWLDHVTLMAENPTRKFYAKRDSEGAEWRTVRNDFMTPGNGLVFGEPITLFVYMRDYGAMLNAGKVGFSLGVKDKFWLNPIADMGSDKEYSTFTKITHEGLRLRASWNLKAPHNAYAWDIWVTAKSPGLKLLDSVVFEGVLRYKGEAPPVEETGILDLTVKGTDGVGLGDVVFTFLGTAAITGAGGKFTSNPAPTGHYSTTLKKTGYQDRLLDFDIGPGTNTASVTMFLLEEPGEELPPEVPPEIPPTAIQQLTDAIKGAYAAITAPTYLQVLRISEYFLGRIITETDAIELTKHINEIFPSLNFISKLTLHTDLSTGEHATLDDITEDEIIAVISDAALIAVGGKLMSTSMAAANEARQASILTKVISNPAKLTASGQKYAAYLRKSSPLAGQLISGTAAVSPKVATGIISRLATSIKLNPYPMLIVSIITLSQLDVIGWGFDSLPKQVRDRQKDRYKTIQSLMFTLQDALDASNFIAAREVAKSIKAILEEIELDLARRIPQFWESRGTSYDDIRAMVRGYRAALNALNDKYPQLDVDFDLTPLPEELSGTIIGVHDGDTITLSSDEFPGREFTVRLLMIDTHEAGTNAGVIERVRLSDIILNKPVVVDVDLYHQWDMYGRVLGVVFIETPEGAFNVNLEMLRQFGKEILTNAKYHHKNKYVDWDEAIRAAESAPVEAPEPRKPTLAHIRRQFVHAYIELDEARSEIAALGYSDEDIAELIAEFVDARAKEEAKEAPPEEVPGIPPELPPEEMVGTIAVRCNKRNANIYLDDEFTYLLTPETLKNIPGGVHTIRVEFAGYATQTKTVEITAPGQKIEIYFTLEETE